MIRLLLCLLLILTMPASAADVLIPNMGAASAISGTDLFPVYQGANPAKAATANQMKTFMSAGGGGGGVSSINGATGAFTLGYGLGVNTSLAGWEIAPWTPYTPNNVISQITGSPNVLRNSTMTSWTHNNYMTNNNSGVTPYNNGIASFTGQITTTTLTTSSVTGTIQPFQRLTDAVVLNTSAATAAVASSPGAPTTCPTACTLQFSSGPPATILVGQYATDIQPGSEKAIPGNATVASINTTAHTVTLTQPVGYSDNTQRNGLGAGVLSGDAIAFSTVKRGTMIQQQLTGTTGGAGTYQIYPSQTVASETMGSSGGYAGEGMYMIPVGTAGASNYVTCIPVQSNGSFAPVTTNCTITGSLSDLIFRFPIDSVDAARVNCSVYTGAPLDCVSALFQLQPITFQLWMTFQTGMPSTPTLDTKISCPLYPASLSGANLCLDDWTNATTDLAPVALPPCYTTAATPVSCSWSYTWVPTGINGNMEIEFHTGAVTTGKFIIVDAFELKQTPGATCAGIAPPCLLLYGSPITTPPITDDIRWNQRFAQALGSGTQAGWNPSNAGAVETTAGYAFNTTNFLASWPLQTSLKCDVWTNATKVNTTCPVPVFYYNNPANYQFWTAGASFNSTAIAVNRYGLNSIQLNGTTSGLTTATAGYVQWVNNESFVDSSYTSFGD